VAKQSLHERAAARDHHDSPLIDLPEREIQARSGAAIASTQAGRGSIVSVVNAGSRSRHLANIALREVALGA
jgi:hypothetical protein